MLMHIQHPAMPIVWHNSLSIHSHIVFSQLPLFKKPLSVYTQSHCVLLVLHLSWFILASWCPFSLGITYKKTIVINEMNTIENMLTAILLQAEKQLVLQPSIPNCHHATSIATLPNSYSLAWACWQTKSCSSNNQFEHDKAIHKYLNKK